MPKAHCNQPTYDVKAHLSRKELRAILDAHGIPASDRPAIAALVYHGKPVSPALHAKLDGRWRGSRRNGAYAKCVKAILQALSADSEHQFPPKSYRVPKGYDFYGTQPKSAA